MWTIQTASDAIGGLSNPGKMPSVGTSLPAAECITGSKLRNVDGSTCSNCYAMKGAYTWGNVQSALYRRLEIVREACADPEAGERWADAFAFLLNTRLENQRRKLERNPEAPIGSDAAFFRWHDSGDLQSLEHLVLVVEVAKRTPDIRHWLPTREISTVNRYLKTIGPIPANLTVRISAAKVDTRAPRVDGCASSTVHTDSDAIGHECPAYQNDGKCGDCRACWDPSIQNVSYPLH